MLKYSDYTHQRPGPASHFLDLYPFSDLPLPEGRADTARESSGLAGGKSFSPSPTFSSLCRSLSVSIRPSRFYSVIC